MVYVAGLSAGCSGAISGDGVAVREGVVGDDVGVGEERGVVGGEDHGGRAVEVVVVDGPVGDGGAVLALADIVVVYADTVTVKWLNG